MDEKNTNLDHKESIQKLSQTIIAEIKAGTHGKEVLEIHEAFLAAFQNYMRFNNVYGSKTENFDLSIAFTNDFIATLELYGFEIVRRDNK